MPASNGKRIFQIDLFNSNNLFSIYTYNVRFKYFTKCSFALLNEIQKPLTDELFGKSTIKQPFITN